MIFGHKTSSLGGSSWCRNAVCSDSAGFAYQLPIKHQIGFRGSILFFGVLPSPLPACLKFRLGFSKEYLMGFGAVNPFVGEDRLGLGLIWYLGLCC